jgi:hypothetical protein
MTAKWAKVPKTRKINGFPETNHIAPTTNPSKTEKRLEEFTAIANYCIGKDFNSSNNAIKVSQ